MQKLKVFQIMFSIAAILFVARPFLGFEAFSHQGKPHVAHSMLAKSFTKRKPENLDDARAKAAGIQQSIQNPPLVLLAGFLLFLTATSAIVLSSTRKLTTSFISAISRSLFPPEPAYLLSGKLVI